MQLNMCKHISINVMCTDTQEGSGVHWHKNMKRKVSEKSSNMGGLLSGWSFIGGSIVFVHKCISPNDKTIKMPSTFKTFHSFLLLIRGSTVLVIN